MALISYINGNIAMHKKGTKLPLLGLYKNVIKSGFFEIESGSKEFVLYIIGNVNISRNLWHLIESTVLNKRNGNG